MDTLWILQAHLSVLIRLVDSLWLAVEDDLLEFGWVHACLVSLFAGHDRLVGELVLEDTLTASNHPPIISVFLQFLKEPLYDFDKGFIVTA